MNQSTENFALPSPSIQFVTFELIKGSIQSARQQMEALIDRTAMSPFMREKKDYFTAYFDRDGKLVSSSNLPIAAGNLIDCILTHYPKATMRPGDIFCYNDAYGSEGAVSHMPDMVFVAPVFYQGEVCAFAEAWGHLWDIGGMHPGSISPDATDIFQEGVVIPAMQICSADVLNNDLLRLILRNTRYPAMVSGDITALIACVRLGRLRFEQIIARFGHDEVEAALKYMLTQSEMALRVAIEQKIPNGRFSFRDWIDGDGVSDKSYSVAVTIAKNEREVSLDFTESDDAAKGAINFIMQESVPKFMTGLYLTASDPAIQMNAGFERAIGQIKRRSGSIVAPLSPAPIGIRAHTMTRVNSALFGALARATEGQCSAASAVYVLYYLRSLNPETQSIDLCAEGLAVGFGARTHADGIDAVYYVAQKNYPIEFAEMEFNVRIEAFGIHKDSGGPGRFRGGCGIFRDVRIVAKEATFGVRMDNALFPAWGVNGGMSGGSGSTIINPGTPTEKQLNSMSDGHVLHEGDLVRLITAGGGGWGDPTMRPSEQVCLDVLDGFVSVESARNDYGVVLSVDGFSVDHEATIQLRSTMPKPTKMFHRRTYFDTNEHHS
jgi:N-methylhydantoinase B